MALKLKGRIKRECGQACSHSTLITAEWRDKSGKGGRRKALVGVEQQLKCEKVPTFRLGRCAVEAGSTGGALHKALNNAILHRNQCYAKYDILFAFLLSLIHLVFYFTFYFAFDCMLSSPAEQHFGHF